MTKPGQRFIKSKTAWKQGWGSTPYRSVKDLTASERQAVKDGHIVWFSFTPWHYLQSGYKVVTYSVNRSRFDSREPTASELTMITNIQDKK